MFQTTNQMSIPTIIRRSSPTLQIRFKWAEERLPVSQLSASDDSDDLFFLWRFKKWPDKLCSGHLVCCSKAKAFGGRPAKHTIPIPEAHVDKEWQLTFLPNCSQIPSICVKLTVLHSATKAWARLWMDAGNSVMALLPQESDCKPAVHVRLRDNIENKNTNNIKKTFLPFLWSGICVFMPGNWRCFFDWRQLSSTSHQVPGCSIGLCLEARPSVMGQYSSSIVYWLSIHTKLNIRHRTLIMWHGLSVFLIFCEINFCAPDLSLSWLDAKSIVRRLAASGYDNVDPASQHHSIWNDFGHTLW